jgi:hypothetical protein
MWTLTHADGTPAVESVSSGFDTSKARDYSHDELAIYFNKRDANNARRHLSEARGEDLKVVPVEVVILKAEKKRGRR